VAAEYVRDNGYADTVQTDGRVMTPDDASATDEVPVMQRLYDRIWLLAAAALLFFAISYVGWGWVDVFSVPTG